VAQFDDLLLKRFVFTHQHLLNVLVSERLLLQLSLPTTHTVTQGHLQSIKVIRD